ncbi:hypothetical protein BV25DRAFT_1880011 [Artomyces pyxidatus]|uniref:Uncharacterized protein n=1 Tax=Artomyces pyxidatus TaxID=48021 RepID=A0ACB8TAL8_9AGAM|nr:hypothetical protein BV25DRAFT_1880011 [Artomyces pyxidatus]
MRPSGSNSDLYRFHRPKLSLQDTPYPLKRESKQCLRNLASYRTPRAPPYPRAQCAAVLVALFVGRMGDLYVLLSRRSETLRAYAGDTALPGGKVDPEDRTIEDTARREAFEEIGLPRDKQRVPLLCVLEPFLAGNEMLVTPVVVLILDNTLRPVLNTPEVHTLFSHPLASFLSSSFPSSASLPSSLFFANAEAYTETAALELKYHTYTDIRSLSGPLREPEARPLVRMHRFLTGREAGGIKPIFGLTAAIMIRTASVAYERTPDFTVHAPGEPPMGMRVAWTLRRPGERLREALANEGCEGNKLEKLAKAWEQWKWGPSAKGNGRNPRRVKL